MKLGSTPQSSALRALLGPGAVAYAITSETITSAANRTPDCQRKMVWVNGITPVIDRIDGGRLAGLACNCAAEDDSPSAHTAPSPR